ncbi:MAG: protein phosphatase 2C domain-containing protein [Terracidiphilus sp.]
MTRTPPVRLPAITVAERCDRGLVREENQDSVWKASIPMGQLLVVADGIGGYRGGALASQIVVREFHQQLASRPADYPADQALREAAAAANSAILAESSAPNSPNHRMGSTVVAAIVQLDAAGARAWVGHIGDSRAYLCRDGRMTPLTRDHSAVQALLNRGLITPEEALHHPDASVLTRSLGHTPEVQIDTDQHQLAPGDTLLLCSDGLWGYVAEQQVQMVAADPNLSLEKAAQTLLDLALAAGGQDNIGIEMARLSAAAAPRAARTLPDQPRHRLGWMEILAIFLLTFACLGVTAWAALHFGWIGAVRARLHPNAPVATQPAADAPLADDRYLDDVNPEPKTYVVVFANREDEAKAAVPPVKGWTRESMDESHADSCRGFAGTHRRITVYYTGNDRRLVARFAHQHPALMRGYEHDIDPRPTNPDVQSRCGSYEIVALVPAHLPPPHPETPQPAGPDAPRPAVEPGPGNQPVNPGGQQPNPPAPTPPPQAQPQPGDQPRPTPAPGETPKPAPEPKDNKETPKPAPTEPRPAETEHPH